LSSKKLGVSTAQFFALFFSLAPLVTRPAALVDAVGSAVADHGAVGVHGVELELRRGAAASELITTEGAIDWLDRDSCGLRGRLQEVQARAGGESPCLLFGVPDALQLLDLVLDVEGLATQDDAAVGQVLDSDTHLALFSSSLLKRRPGANSSLQPKFNFMPQEPPAKRASPVQEDHSHLR
jgi:hypothetical protein